MSNDEKKVRKAPVVMVGYVRSNTLKRCLDNLSRCEGVSGRDIFLFLDPPPVTRIAQDGRLSELMIETALSFKHILPNMDVICREHNLGCPGNVIASIGEVVNRYDRVIFFEDDVLVSRTFLTYMDAGLDSFEKDPRIWGINGWKDRLIHIPRSYPYEFYLSPRHCAWGFATWKDRWNAVDFEMRDWPSFRKEPDNLRKLNVPGYGIRLLIEGEYGNRHQTWDVECVYHMVKNGLFSVEPRHSLTKNIGFGEPSEHSDWKDWNIITQKYYNVRPDFPDKLQLDERILRAYECQTAIKYFLQGVYRVFHRHVVRWFGRNDEPLDA